MAPIDDRWVGREVGKERIEWYIEEWEQSRVLHTYVPKTIRLLSVRWTMSLIRNGGVCGTVCTS